MFRWVVFDRMTRRAFQALFVILVGLYGRMRKS